MKVIESIAEWRELRRTLPGSLGFVPTMGALHRGHAALLKRSASENAVSVLSIYLNPTQFNNSADLAGYPKTLQRDLRIACRMGADYVITPRYAEMSADDFRY